MTPVEVEARAHARPEDLVNKVAGVFEQVPACAVVERQTAGDDTHFVVPKKSAINVDTARVTLPWSATGYLGWAGVVEASMRPLLKPVDIAPLQRKSSSAGGQTRASEFTHRPVCLE